MSSDIGHPAALPPDQLEAQCDLRRTRRSGPGGQHRNKVESAVILIHRLTGIQAEANERRSQAENRKVAIRRLRVNLAIEIRVPVQGRSVPGGVWIARCHDGRLSVNPQHDDFPTLLADALDMLQDQQWSVSDAAQRLGCTTSQLVKLLKQVPKALQRVNQQRAKAGQTPLK